MGLFKKIKKAAGRALKASVRIGKQGMMRDSKMMMGPFSGAAGAFGGGEKETEEQEPPEEAGQRAAAAKRLAEIQKQAGGGQIKYNGMEDVPS